MRPLGEDCGAKSRVWGPTRAAQLKDPGRGPREALLVRFGQMLGDGGVPPRSSLRACEATRTLR